MSFGDRLGIAGLIMGALGVGCAILWPTQRWIGWLFIVIAVVCGVGWGIGELRDQHPTIAKGPPIADIAPASPASPTTNIPVGAALSPCQNPLQFSVTPLGIGPPYLRAVTVTVKDARGFVLYLDMPLIDNLPAEVTTPGFKGSSGGGGNGMATYVDFATDYHP